MRRRTGIEPANDAMRRSSVLKTGGATRHPDASGADVTCAEAVRAIGLRSTPSLAVKGVFGQGVMSYRVTGPDAFRLTQFAHRCGCEIPPCWPPVT